MRNPTMRNPSAVGKQRMTSPVGNAGRNKGNAPWLKVRRRFRKSVFRGM